MIPFFTGFAVIVWWLAGSNRRTLRGFVFVALGAAFMAMVIAGHYALGVWSEGRIYMEVLQPILYGYGIVVIGMGVYIACLPRRVEHGPSCYACGYDVRLLSSRVCPECGVAIPVSEPKAAASSPDEPHDCAAYQHGERHSQCEQKPERSEPILLDRGDHRRGPCLGALSDQLVHAGEE